MDFRALTFGLLGVCFVASSLDAILHPLLPRLMACPVAPGWPMQAHDPSARVVVRGWDYSSESRPATSGYGSLIAQTVASSARSAFGIGMFLPN